MDYNKKVLPCCFMQVIQRKQQMGKARSLGWKCKDKVRQDSLYQSHSWEIQSITAAKRAGIKNNTRHTNRRKMYTLSLFLLKGGSVYILPLFRICVTWCYVQLFNLFSRRINIITIWFLYIWMQQCNVAEQSICLENCYNYRITLQWFIVFIAEWGNKGSAEFHRLLLWMQIRQGHFSQLGKLQAFRHFSCRKPHFISVEKNNQSRTDWLVRGSSKKHQEERARNWKPHRAETESWTNESL